MLAHILKWEIQPIAHLVVNTAGNANFAGFSQRLNPGCDINSFTVDVFAIINNIT